LERDSKKPEPSTGQTPPGATRTATHEPPVEESPAAKRDRRRD
jgi:hypothetical protein